ncbi:MAG: extracellular solute-binding protein [Acholeplasmataceae bacterium]
MKKIISIVFMVIAILVLNACSSNSLVIYIPKNYISNDVVKAFEKESGIKVELRVFDSNEIALTQARINRYDLIIPSDYAIEEFAAAGLIKELDWSRIEFDKSDFTNTLVDMLDELKGDGFDLLKYGMPYFWGSIGLIYDNNKAGLLDQLNDEGWGILQDQSLTKMIYKSPRDAIMAALYGMDDMVWLKDATEDDIKDARRWLVNAKGSNTVIKSEEISDEASGGNIPYDIAMVYSGDAVDILQETEGYSFFIPEYSNVWVDAFVIPENTRHEDWAYDFINYISSYDAMLENTEYICYSPVMQQVLDDLLEDEEFTYDERISYAFDIDLDKIEYEFFRYNNELKKWIDEQYDLFIFS